MLPLIPLALELLPTIGRWVAGDTGGRVATAAAQAIQTITGTDTPDAARAAIAADPALAAQVRIRLAEIEAEEEKDRRATELAALTAELKGVADARARDLALQLGGRRNVRADILLIVACLGLVVCIIAAATGKIAADSAAMGMIISVAGVLAGCFKDAFGFEFGSSRSSERKTELIAISPAVGGQQ